MDVALQQYRFTKPQPPTQMISIDSWLQYIIYGIIQLLVLVIHQIDLLDIRVASIL